MYGRVGQVEEALSAIADAMSHVERTGERYFEAEVHRIKGELLRMKGVGAVAGGVVQRLRVIIRPLRFYQVFRLHLPGGVRDCPTVEAGAAYAQQTVPTRLEELAREAGADQVEVRMTRRDWEAPSAMEDLLCLGAELVSPPWDGPAYTSNRTRIRLSEDKGWVVR
jgi:hypothetical protein